MPVWNNGELLHDLFWESRSSLSLRSRRNQEHHVCDKEPPSSEFCGQPWVSQATFRNLERVLTG